MFGKSLGDSRAHRSEERCCMCRVCLCLTERETGEPKGLHCLEGPSRMYCRNVLVCLAVAYSITRDPFFRGSLSFGSLAVANVFLGAYVVYLDVSSCERQL